MDSNKIGGPISPLDVEKLRNNRTESTEKAKGSAKTGSIPFSELLEKRLDKPAAKAPDVAGELKFSAHAQTRLQSRGIELTPDEIVKLQEAVGKARDKGSKESLVLTDKAAFIVSVKNQTVITAMDRQDLKDNVFTNIDSTVMI
jgi:flagellar operon protein